MPREFEVKVSKLKGSPAAERGKSVKVFEYTPEEIKDLPQNRGRLFAVVEVTVDDPDVDSSLASKLVWDTLADGYYDLSEEMPVRALEEAVYAARDKLRDFSEDSSLDLLTVALWGGVAYFARVGRPVLYLRRGPEVRELLSGEESVSIGSQILEEDDVLIAGSPVFGRNFTVKSLPQTRFLVEQFEQDAKVPGFAALLLRVGSSREAREEAVKKVGVARLASPKLKQRLERVPSKVSDIISSIKSGSLSLAGVGGKISTALEERVSRGKELAAERKVSQIAPPFSLKIERLSRISLPRIILILAVLLLISISFTTWRQGQKAKAAEFDRLVAQASQGLDEAEGLVSLSNERAKELLDESRANLANADELFSNSEEVSTLQAEADTLYNAIEKITPVGDDKAVYDLSLNVERARGVALSGSGGTVYVVEQTSGSVLSVKLGELPQVSVLGEGKLVGVKELVHEAGYLYLLAEKTIYRLKLSNKKVDEPITFDRCEKAVAIDTYLGNVYLLVSDEDQVYKFWNLTGGYSKAVSWIKEAINLGSVIDMGVDGALWLLTEQGQVMRLFQGKKKPFSISNLSTPFQQPNKIFTHPDLKRVYILDVGNQRVVVLDKNGNFIRQFKGDVLSESNDLWVSDDEKNLYILSGSKIYKVGL